MIAKHQRSLKYFGKSFTEILAKNRINEKIYEKIRRLSIPKRNISQLFEDYWKLSGPIKSTPLKAFNDIDYNEIVLSDGFKIGLWPIDLKTLKISTLN